MVQKQKRITQKERTDQAEDEIQKSGIKLTVLRFQTGGGIRNPRPPFGGSMSIYYVMHKSTVMRSLNVIAYMLSKILPISIRIYSTRCFLNSPVSDAVIEKFQIYTLKTIQIALIEIQPISPTSLVGSSGMGTQCLTPILNDAHHSLVSTPKARTESMR